MAAMTRVVFKKIAELIVVLFIVSLGTFGLLSLMPGDPSVVKLGTGRTPEEYAAAREAMGLNDPFFTRYWHWLSGALQGDLGKSLPPPRPTAPPRPWKNRSCTSLRRPHSTSSRSAS